MEVQDSNKQISVICGVELVLLVPLLCRRRSAFRTINWASKGVLGAWRGYDPWGGATVWGWRMDSLVCVGCKGFWPILITKWQGRFAFETIPRHPALALVPVATQFVTASSAACENV